MGYNGIHRQIGKIQPTSRDVKDNGDDDDDDDDDYGGGDDGK